MTRRTVAFVRGFEGFRARAAACDGGWTLGYGHTSTAREGAEVTRADAEVLLAYDLTRVAGAIEPLIYTPLEANAFDALVSFAFSIGAEAFRRSEVRRRLNKGAYLQAAAALELWRLADLQGEMQVVDALVRRRAAEKALFLTPGDGFPAAPSSIVRPRLDAAMFAAATRLAGNDAANAAIVAQPPATEVIAPSASTDAAARPVGREPEARLQAGLRAEVIDALAQRLDRALERRETSATSPAIPVSAFQVDDGRDPSPPPRLGDTIPRIEAQAARAPGFLDLDSLAAPELPATTRRGLFTDFRRATTQLRHSGIFLAIFLLGAGLFLVAAVCIADRPTLGLLALGLLGVLVMAPAAVQMLTSRRR